MFVTIAVYIFVWLRLICSCWCTLYKIGCIKKNSNNEHCFYEHRGNLTWYQSREFCVKMAMRLAQVDMPETQSYIETYMGKFGTYEAWIAGEQTNLQDWQWLNGKSVESVSPQGGGDMSESACAAMMSIYNNTQLNNQTKLVYVGSPCNTRCHFVCEYSSSDKCQGISDGNVLHNGTCYRKYTANDTTEKTWFTARNFCQAEGGDLAVLPKDINLTSINPLVVGISGQLWIGIDRAKWNWVVNGSYSEEIVFTKWIEGEPKTKTEGCIAVEPSAGGWTVRNCSLYKNQICEQIKLNV